MELEENILREWFNALFLDNCNRSTTHVADFKKEHQEIYTYLHSFYRLRSDLYYDIRVMSLVGTIHWFTLTFDNKRDKSLITTKRKNATRFLNDIFIVYEMVEEFGEDNGRYHIHGFGVYRYGKGFEDFRKWPSRQKIEPLNEYKLKKKVKYLTKYAVKDLPRRRRSKGLVYLVRYYKSHKSLITSFDKCFNCYFNVALLKLDFGVYNKVSKEPTSTTI